MFTLMRNLYDVTSGGERFIVGEPDETTARRELHVILNWQTSLER